MKRLLLLVALAAALLFPASAAATHECACVWHWGFNYITPGVNFVVTSGYNYWSDQYADKWNGGWIFHGFLQTNDQGCWDEMDGVTSHYHLRGDFPGGGCDPYVRNFLHYGGGNSSYTYADSWAFYRG